MEELIVPDREPDYISKGGCKYWFSELIYMRYNEVLGGMYVDRAKLCSDISNADFIEEIQIAFKRWLDESIVFGFENCSDSTE